MRKPIRIIRLALQLLIVSLAALGTLPASAGTVALTLVRSDLRNVDDAAGRWQHEGGTLRRGNAVVGQYAIYRRVTTAGTSAQNTAMQTVTLFFANTGAPPQNVTLQGAHTFSSCGFAGSVSSASNRFSWIKGADAVIAASGAAGTSTLTIRWTAADQLTLP